MPAHTPPSKKTSSSPATRHDEPPPTKTSIDPKRLEVLSEFGYENTISNRPLAMPPMRAPDPEPITASTGIVEMNVQGSLAIFANEMDAAIATQPSIPDAIPVAPKPPIRPRAPLSKPSVKRPTLVSPTKESPSTPVVAEPAVTPRRPHIQLPQWRFSLAGAMPSVIVAIVGVTVTLLVFSTKASSPDAPQWPRVERAPRAVAQATLAAVAVPTAGSGTSVSRDDSVGRAPSTPATSARERVAAAAPTPGTAVQRTTPRAAAPRPEPPRASATTAARASAPPAPVKPKPVAQVAARTNESAPVRFHGALQIVSTPPGARVFVDGRPAGSTPLVLDDVSIGTRVVRVEADGYQRWSSAIRVIADQQTSVSAALTPAP